MAEREFVIPVRRRWLLAILPILAILYFAFVVTLASLNYTIRGVSMEMLAFGGVGFFVLVILVELPFFFTRRIRDDEAEPSPVAAAPSSAAPGARDDELVTTTEQQQGLRVLEYSRPAKSRNRGAVYAKAYVPVTKEYVVRVETLVADRADL